MTITENGYLLGVTASLTALHKHNTSLFGVDSQYTAVLRLQTARWMLRAHRSTRIFFVQRNWAVDMYTCHSATATTDRMCLTQFQLLPYSTRHSGGPRKSVQPDSDEPVLQYTLMLQGVGLPDHLTHTRNLRQSHSIEVPHT